MNGMQTLLHSGFSQTSSIQHLHVDQSWLRGPLRRSNPGWICRIALQWPQLKVEHSAIILPLSRSVRLAHPRSRSIFRFFRLREPRRFPAIAHKRHFDIIRLRIIINKAAYEFILSWSFSAIEHVSEQKRRIAVALRLGPISVHPNHLSMNVSHKIHDFPIISPALQESDEIVCI